MRSPKIGSRSTNPAISIGPTFCRSDEISLRISRGWCPPHHYATMARAKAVAKSTPKEEKAADAPLTTKASHGTPYQLDPAQVDRAATALVAHMKQHAQAKEEKTGKRNLAADEDEAEADDEPIFLSVSTKKHVHNTSRLKPTKLFVPPVQISITTNAQ